MHEAQFFYDIYQKQKYFFRHFAGKARVNRPKKKKKMRHGTQRYVVMVTNVFVRLNLLHQRDFGKAQRKIYTSA